MTRTLSIAIACLFLSVACTNLEEPGTATTPGTDSGQRIDLALTSVPTGVQCVSVTATFSTQTITRQFTLAAGASTAALSLGQLPAGTATLRGAAFNLACASIGGATASYIADPLSVTLRPGVVSSAELTFRPNNAVGLSVNFLGNVAEVSVGWFESMARMTDGTLRFWGGDGQIGGTSTATPVPASLGLTNVAQLGLGKNIGCVLKTDGSVVCWGFINDPNVSISPVTVNLPGSAVQLAVSHDHACAALASGLLACWGNDNSAGQLGNGGTALASTSAPSFVALNNQAGIGKVVVGYRATCVVDSSGRATCWGDNSQGRFGNGGTTSSPTPVPAAVGLGAIVDLRLGDAHACAVRADGTLHCWGDNSVGQLGDGTSLQRLTPGQVPGLSQVAQVATGSIHTCAVSQAGQLWCWGNNVSGQLGDGTGNDQHSPVAIMTGVAAVRANANVHTCAEMQDLTVRCWGFNDVGQLGTGTLANSSIPATVRLQ